MKQSTSIVFTTLLMTMFGGGVAIAGQTRAAEEPALTLTQSTLDPSSPAGETVNLSKDADSPSLEIPAPEDEAMDELSVDELPGDDAPGIETPDVESPGIDAPGIDAPDVDSPEADLPNIDAPDIDVPEIDLPKASDLEGSAEADTSEADMSEEDVTEADAPELETVDPAISESEAADPTESETLELDEAESEASDLGEADLGESGYDVDESLEEETPGEEAAAEEAATEDAAAEDAAIDAATMKLKQAANVSLSQALEQVGQAADDAEAARSITFFGDVEQPLIGIEIGTRAIAINALDGEIIGTQEIDDLPNPEQRAALEAAATLKTFATASLQDAIAAAEAYAGEAPHRVILEVDDGNLIYKASVAEEDVFVDAGDAKVLYTEGQQTVPETGEKPRSSVQVSDLLDNPMP